MKLTLERLKDKSLWRMASIGLPKYDTRVIAEETKQTPVWVHFRAGNILHIFIGGLADRLIESGESNKGITCMETLDSDAINQTYKPYDNSVLAVILKADGSANEKVTGPLTEALKAQSGVKEKWGCLKEVSINPAPQIISFIIMEKDYTLKGSDGTYFSFIQAGVDSGSDKTASAMVVVYALLYKRYKACEALLTVVPMDNCSHNGEKLQSSVFTTTKEWNQKGYVEDGFIVYLSDENQVFFPWSMIDKVTPRPVDSVCAELEKAGVEDTAPVIASKKTCIAPFVNAEESRYPVIKDKFPSGRPALKKVGIYMTDRDTVNKVERMKVATCLSPLHTALAVYDCMLRYTLIADGMKDEQPNRLVHEIDPVEGMPVVTDPGILSSEDFASEVINVRVPNPFTPDIPQGIAANTSQKAGIRYGETIKVYAEKYGDAKKLKVIPLAFTGWCRCLLAADDEDNAFELSADPMVSGLTAALKGTQVGTSESYAGQLRPILSNADIFGIDLYRAGIGETVETMFQGEVAGPGTIRATSKKYVGQFQVPQGNTIGIHHKGINPRSLPLEP